MRIAGLVTTCGEPTTDDAIRSLNPFVDRLFVGIDERSDYQPPTEEVSGVDTFRYRFADNFSAPTNDFLAGLEGFDWIVHLDGDERIIVPGPLAYWHPPWDSIHAILERNADADVIACPRRHFEDRAGRVERYWNYPDLQYRIRRPHVRMRGRAHPMPVVDPAKIARTSLVTIDHFNLAIRSEADWAIANERFRRLESLDAADGG